MSNIVDFGIGEVLTAPSPATSGTSLVLKSGHGSLLPATPFNATAVPKGFIPTKSVAERILVTGKTSDTLTFTRAQGGTTAQSIASGWLIINSIFTDDLFYSSLTPGEIMGGTANGTNKVFTTLNAFSLISVYKNGVRMVAGVSADYVVTNSTTITFNTAPASGAIIVADYIMGSSVMISGSNSLITGIVPTGSVNGSNTAFTTPQSYVGGSLEVFVNGVSQARTTHFTETGPSAGTFSLSDAPLTGDIITVSYQYASTVTANADTVDGIHANTVATANTLFPLDANGKFGSSILDLDFVETTLGASFTSSASNTWQDTGFNITLPTAGKWLIMSDLRVVMTSNTTGIFASLRLYNTTAGAAVTNSERIAVQNSGANQYRATIPITMRITTTVANTVIRIDIQPGGAYTAVLESDPNGKSHIMAFRVG